MIWVAIGGVIGSLFRYLLNELLGSSASGVMAANLIGVAVAGIAVMYCTKNPNPNLRHFLLPGFCGGLTTFSSAMMLSQSEGFAYIFETLALSLLIITFIIPVARKRFGVTI
mgnify:FL=1